jgi:hypothetical protein
MLRLNTTRRADFSKGKEKKKDRKTKRKSKTFLPPREQTKKEPEI